MGKDKLKRFAENETFQNLIQPTLEEVQGNFFLKGKWGKDFFKNTNPIVLELGCGRGEYSVGLARKYREKNFIGIDRKGARVWRGAKTAVEDNLTNAGFLRTRIEFLDKCFEREEVSEIWITFPDPHLKFKKINNRLTSPHFLSKYKEILLPEGIIHLKTDSDFLYEFTVQTIKEYKHSLIFETNDLYAKGNDLEVAEIRTFYESMFLNQEIRIKYIQFKLNLKE